MTIISSKSAVLTATILLGSLLSFSANANVLRTVEGTPVMTTGGNCVLTGTDGATADCGAAPEAAAPVKATFDRERTVFFGFDKSNLTPASKHHLDRLIKKLHAKTAHGHTVQNITIVGYADAIGNVAYNEKLALKRAKAVHDYMTSKGVKAKKIEVRSLGKSSPKTECPPNLPRAKMIECLHDDRRVEIEVNAAK